MTAVGAHVSTPYENGCVKSHGFYALKTLQRRIKDRRTWQWEAYSRYCSYLVSGLAEKTPSAVMLVEECAFIKLRLDLWKIGFFNEKNGGATEHYLAFTNSFARTLDKLKLQWGEDAPTLEDFMYADDEEETAGGES